MFAVWLLIFLLLKCNCWADWLCWCVRVLQETDVTVLRAPTTRQPACLAACPNNTFPFVQSWALALRYNFIPTEDWLGLAAAPSPRSAPAFPSLFQLCLWWLLAVGPARISPSLRVCWPSISESTRGGQTLELKWERRFLALDCTFQLLPPLPPGTNGRRPGGPSQSHQHFF